MKSENLVALGLLAGGGYLFYRSSAAQKDDPQSKPENNEENPFHVIPDGSNSSGDGGGPSGDGSGSENGGDDLDGGGSKVYVYGTPDGQLVGLQAILAYLNGLDNNSVDYYLNTGAIRSAEEALTRMRQLCIYLEEGYRTNFAGWGADEFDRFRDQLRKLGLPDEEIDRVVPTFDTKRTFIDKVLGGGTQVIGGSGVASFVELITTWETRVNRAKESPLVVYGAANMTTTLYEASARNIDNCSIPYAVTPLTVNYDNMRILSPRKKEGTNWYAQTVTRTRVGNSNVFNYNVVGPHVAMPNTEEGLNCLRSMSDTRKMAPAAENGCLGVLNQGFDMNLFVIRSNSIIRPATTLAPGRNMPNATYVRDGKLGTYEHFDIKLKDVVIQDPTISKLRKMFGIGNIGVFDLFILEMASRHTGIRDEWYMNVVGRSEDIDVSRFPEFFDEDRGVMTISIGQQTSFVKGQPTTQDVECRFFCLTGRGCYILRGITANEIEMIGELRGEFFLPTADFTLLNTSEGLCIKYNGSTTTDNVLESTETVVIALKTSKQVSALLVEDESCIVPGQRRMINFQEKSREGDSPD